jgi:hypothetical protein
MSKLLGTLLYDIGGGEASSRLAVEGAVCLTSSLLPTSLYLKGAETSSPRDFVCQSYGEIVSATKNAILTGLSSAPFLFIRK